MIVSIHQPAYLPWLGYLHRIAVSDLHVVLDHVQFEKNSFINRNKVRTHAGWCWLTVPLATSHRFGDLAIHQVQISDDPRWARKHWETLRQSYARAEHFAAYAPWLEESYARPWRRLAELIAEMTAWQLEAFGIRTPLVYSSQLGVGGVKSDLVLNLCREVGADAYLSGPLGRDYLDEAAFARAGIEIAYHDFRHPVYRQIHGQFESGMAAIDLLFNHGRDDARSILMTSTEAALR